MKETKNQRFKIVRETLKLDQNTIAKGLNVGQGTISGIENGRSGISKKILQALSDVYGVNPEYIETGTGKMIIHTLIKKEVPPSIVAEENAHYSIIPPSKANMFIVPIKAYGGFLAGYSNKAYMDSLEKISYPWVRGECYAFEVEGFSMVSDNAKEESYYPGTMVVCTELNGLWMQKNKAYVFVTIDGIILKIFDHIDDQFCHLRSLNPAKEYLVKPIPLKNIKRIFHIENKITKP
jgi:transcriptional regulator with XRE-family HTH domain